MKLRNMIVISAGFALALIIAVGAEGAKEAPAKKVKCPVAGKEISLADAKVAKYKGAKVYVCCNGCKGKLEADGSKFAAKANHQLVLTGQAKQNKCPIAGRPINKKMVVTVGGVDVGLCCGGCKAKASKAAGDAQVTLLFSDAAFEKGFAIAKPKK